MRFSFWLRSAAACALVCLGAVLSAAPTFVAQYLNLESAAWTQVTGPSISQVASTAAAAVPEADGVRMYQIGPAWAGVLFKHACALPPLPAKGSVTLSFDVQTDDAGAIRAQAREFDVMLTDAAGNVYNGSNQLNEAEGGAWQAVNASYHWQDLGFQPGPLPADTWVSVSYTVTFDTVAKTSAVSSVSVGGQAFKPATPLVVPAQALGWAPNIAVVQIQLDENGQAGGYSEKFRNVTLTANW